MLLQLQKGNLLHSGVGYLIFATDDQGHTIMEWEDECACRLSFHFHSVLRRHALGTNIAQKYGLRGLIVRRLEPLPIGVVARASANSAELQFLGSGDSPLTKLEVVQIPGVKPTRLEVMEDTALHAARSLRAYLLTQGVHELALRLAFGVAASGECQLQAINPVECQLGTIDYNALCERLGGDLK